MLTVGTFLDAGRLGEKVVAAFGTASPHVTLAGARSLIVEPCRNGGKAVAHTRLLQAFSIKTCRGKKEYDMLHEIINHYNT